MKPGGEACFTASPLFLYAVLKKELSVIFYNRYAYERMSYMKFLKFCLLAVSAVSGFLGFAKVQKRPPYTFFPQDTQFKAYFSIPFKERQELVRSVKLVKRPESPVTKVENGLLNENVFDLAVRENAKLVSGIHFRVSYGQVEAFRKKNIKVMIEKAENISEVINAILKKPDYILVSEELDIAKLYELLLLEDPGVEFEPYNTRLDSCSPGYGAVCNYQSAAVRPEKSQLRIMSYNILAQIFSHQPLAETRVDDIVSIIKHFAPDIAGLQEVDKIWYKTLEKPLEPYRFVKQKSPDLQGNVSCNIIYDSRRYRQLDGDVLKFTDMWLRCFHWAMFEDIASGRRFIVTNTHWALTVEQRIDNAELMVKYVRELEKKYKVPVFCTGDFNSRLASQELQLFLKKSGMADSVAVAEHKENDVIGSCFATAFYHLPMKNGHIDHVLVPAGVQVQASKLILDEKLLKPSDHLPLVVDISFTK